MKKKLLVILSTLFVASAAFVYFMFFYNTHKITCINEHTNDTYSIRVKEGEHYHLDFEKVPYYECIGFYDEDGALYTNRNGNSLYRYTLEENLTLYVKYTPYQFVINYDLNDTNEKDSIITQEHIVGFGDELPELYDVTKEKHDFLGYQAIIDNNTTITISEGINFLEGFDKITENYANLNHLSSITLKPLFDKKKYNMTFVYEKNGEKVTENRKEYIETSIFEAGPTFVDSLGNTHRYAWSTTEELSSISSLYTGETQEGVTLYAVGLISKHQYSEDNQYLYEIYNYGLNESTLYLPNIYGGSKNISFTYVVASNIETLKISSYAGTYKGFKIEVEERQKDIKIDFINNAGVNKSTITSLEKQPLIEATKLGENQLLTVSIEGLIDFKGYDGKLGAQQIDYSNKVTTDKNEESNKYSYYIMYPGGNGSDIINATNVKIVVYESSTLNIIAGNGGEGESGINAESTNCPGMFTGINGGSAAGGGNGGDGIEAKHLILDIKGTLNVTAGNGGQGGKGGNGSNAVGGSLVEPDCGGDGGSGASGGDGGYCFNIETYSIINYANGTLKAGSAGNGGDGGKGGSSHDSLFHGPGIGSHGGGGGDAGTQGDIGFTIEGGIPENLNYIGSYTAKGGKIGSAGYDGDGVYSGDKEYIYAGDGSHGILFGNAWEENK